MCLNIIRTSIALGNYVHVANYVQKAEGSPDTAADPAVVAKLRVAAGLSLLDGRKFKLAARKFCETPFELGTEFSDVIAPQARELSLESCQKRGLFYARSFATSAFAWQ